MIANKPLNYQAIAIEEAETEIRATVKTEFFKKTPKPLIDKKIIVIIERALKQITIENLKQSAKISLVVFYNRQYRELNSRITPSMIDVILVTGLLLNSSISVTDSRVKALRTYGIEVLADKTVNVPTVNLYGVPLRKFHQDYINNNVKPVFNKLIEEQAKDPNDVRSVNTLRNLAEMEVRYDDHLQQIEDLKKAGNKLVIASTHADCSERCRPYQGRVYSLDGTSGTTSDGRQYVPLEVATNVPYTTKAGKTYMNGLLGFNCRHYLVPYSKGFKFPKPNAKEERRQYAITIKQRQLEREVRKWRTIAVTNKGIDKDAYIEAKEKAEEWNKRYIKFSRDNERAYYPSRTKIL